MESTSRRPDKLSLSLITDGWWVLVRAAEAFVPERLEAQLDAQASAWLANPTKGLAADASARSLTLSKIFS